jgi:hypothetical protein
MALPTETFGFLFLDGRPMWVAPGAVRIDRGSSADAAALLPRKVSPAMRLAHENPQIIVFPY